MMHDQCNRGWGNIPEGRGSRSAVRQLVDDPWPVRFPGPQGDGKGDGPSWPRKGQDGQSLSNGVCSAPLTGVDVPQESDHVHRCHAPAVVCGTGSVRVGGACFAGAPA